MKKQLSNGVRVIYENIPEIKSVTTGIWVKTGSRNESKEINGVSHFIEHMLFKGTEKRTAKDIANEIDFIGGNINAFTSKEYTCYYTKTLDEDLETAIDVLCDILLNSLFDEKEILKERSVILEEISMYEDSPEDLAFELLSSNIWPDSPLGYPVAGTRETVSNLKRDEIINYKSKNYTTSNIVISVAGKFEERKLFELLEEKLSMLKTSGNETIFSPEIYAPNYIYKKKEIEQSNICIALNGFGYDDKHLYPLMIASNILGGTMSSILFQKVREEKGLCYSIYSSIAPNVKNGIMYIYAGTNPAQTEELIKTIFDEIASFKNYEISNEELKRNKQQLKGGLILSFESTSTRMTSMGKSELLQNRVISQEEIISLIDNVTIEDLKETINLTFNPNSIGLSIVSNFEDDSAFKNIFDQTKKK